MFFSKWFEHWIKSRSYDLMVRVRVVLEKKLMSVVVTNVSTTAVEVVSRASGEVISGSVDSENDFR